ncbi:hypothetical protein [Lentzea sp. NPDC060358]|uniref:hypothetical protein n=1 Tax=Lentzea sp. NPDC060358 TaxID=3347103 RepID=UPI00364BEDC5
MNQPPQNWQQQPYGGPPPPGWQPHPPQPPGRSKAPLAIGIIAGILLLGGGAAVGVLYLFTHADSGTAKRSDVLPGICGNISEAALAQARTTNPNGSASRESKLSSGTRVLCSWNQTKGEDGSGQRSTSVSVALDQKDAEAGYDRSVVRKGENAQGRSMQKRLSGLGDEAVAVLVETESAYTRMSVVVRKGDAVVEVDLTGWDAGLFGATKPDSAELEEAAKGMAAEMVAKL